MKSLDITAPRLKRTFLTFTGAATTLLLMIDPTDQKADWTGVIRQMSTSSAANPMLIATVVAFVLCVPALTFGPPEIRPIMSTLLLLIVGAFLIQVLFFTFFDRDRLQNDKHVEKKMLIRQQQISYKEEDGRTVTIDIPKGDLPVQNPRALGLNHE